MARNLSFLLILLSWLSTAPALAQDSELTADQIADKTLRADSFSWEGARTRLRMVLLEKDGDKKERSMVVLARRKDGRLQSMVRFLSPRDLAGTAFLMLEQESGDAEQYIYLSGLKRTRRIVGREREGSFMGSDFTYTDMQPIKAEHAEHKRLPDDHIGKTPAYVIESHLSEASGLPYAKVVTWVRKSDFVALRTRFIDPKGKVVKTLYARRVKELDGKPVVVESRMQTQASGHATDLIIEAMERQKDLPDAKFTPGALERW